MRSSFLSGFPFIEQLMNEVDRANKQQAKDSFGITTIGNKEGIERLGIEHIYESIEVRDAYIYGFHYIDEVYSTSVFTKEGKFLFCAVKVKYVKFGMFVVGNATDNEPYKECGWALYNEGERVSDYIFKPLSDYFFNKEGFIVLSIFGNYNSAVVDRSGKIIYESGSFEYPYIKGVVCMTKDTYINLLTGQRICGKSYSSSLETDEFIFVECGYKSNSVYQINKTTGEFIVHGVPEKYEPPQEPKPYVNQISKATEPKEKEQGRNDLCSCGSGLKYKKCCQLKNKSATQ